MQDDGRPLGDTAEAHDEITPHDLPLDHPGRAEAVRQARRSRRGTTRGDQELVDAGPRRDERVG
jgi:hypothetical protein